MSKAIVIYSGGMDSLTVLHRAIEDGFDVSAISVNYGQRHAKELDYAKRTTEKMGIRHDILEMSFLRDLLGGSSLTSDKPVPLGHYADARMKQTVVPNRNMILLSLAVGAAVAQNAEVVYCGVHAGDHAIYPDCRPKFIDAMDHVSRIANYNPVRIHAPFMRQTKAQILTWGITAGVDYANSWTCYNGREHACGKCGSCVERLEAFGVNRAIDPLTYEV